MGGSLPFLNLFTKKKNKSETTDPAKFRALESINRGWKRDTSKDSNVDHPPTTYARDDVPTKLAGGEINLVRAVFDEAELVIKDVVRELEELESRKQSLLVKKIAHEELLVIAKKYI